MAQQSLITAGDFEEILGAPLGADLAVRCAEAGLRYEELTPKSATATYWASSSVFWAVICRLQASTGWADGRKGGRRTWRHGKQSEITAVLVPHYHDGQALVHWKERIVRPLVPQFDSRHCLACRLGGEYLLGYRGHPDGIWLRASPSSAAGSPLQSSSSLVGLDWATASQRIISEVVASGQETNLSGHNFNFYEPDYSLPFTSNTGVLTVAALEQVGDRFEPFLQFLLAKRPTICVHFEPIDELLDGDSLLDRLTVLYCRKRNYLQGFLPRLRQLEAAGQIVLRQVQRTYQGSYFIEGHSLVVWSPV